MHHCEYCDGNDELLSGIIKGEFRTILYQIGDFSTKCARILEESSNFSQTRREISLQLNENLENVLKIFKRVKMPTAERYPIEL
jgi:hypothetical protein